MTAENRVADPGWEYLLSHHPADRYGRTFRVRVGRRMVHFCARCTGEAVGALAWLAMFGIAEFVRFPFYALPLQLALLAGLPLLASWDWISQSLGHRESNNRLRFLSGAMVGFAFLDLLGALVEGHWIALAAGLLILTGYLAILATILWTTGAWRPVLEQHFPGVEIAARE